MCAMPPAVSAEDHVEYDQDRHGHGKHQAERRRTVFADSLRSPLPPPLAVSSLVEAVVVVVVVVVAVVAAVTVAVVLVLP